MFRRRSAAYEAAAVVGAESSEPETLTRLDSKDAFLDLRIDMCERSAVAAAVRSSAASKATRSPSVKAAHIERARAIAAASQPGALASSDLQRALRRCRSASTIRKKLLHAVEQSSSQMTHDQLALLRSLAASAATKPTPKTLLSRQLSSSDPVSAAVYTTGASSRPSSAAVTSLLPPSHHHHQSYKSRNQDSFASSSTPSRAKSVYTSSSSDTTGPSQRTHGTTRIVGGYKSNTVQLEVELAERLNEIERSKLNEKAVSRFRACRKAFDAVIQQDELYGRLLAKIRDEINAYVDVVSATHSRRDPSATEDCCACSRVPSNQTNDLDFENALFRQENAALKKNCAALQREIEVLQQSLLFATGSKPNDKTMMTTAAALAPEQASLFSDDDDDNSELSEIQLLPDAECHQTLRRPLGIPPLDFTALSPYSEEADDEDEEEEFESGY